MRYPVGVLREVMRWTARPAYGPPVPVRLQRRIGDVLARLQPMPRAVTATEVRLGGVPARRYAPPGASSSGAVLWVHGGAFITGSYLTHGSFGAHLSQFLAAPVYLVDYRLAPEHRHPAAVDDIRAALAHVPEQQVVLGGDSAGGFLALLAVGSDGRRVAGLALVSPMVDLTLASARSWAGAEAFVRPSWLVQGVAAMFGSAVPALDLTGLPPAVVHVAADERLRPEGEKLAAALAAELVVVAPGWHDVHLHAGVLRVAHRAVEQLAGSIGGLLAGATPGATPEGRQPGPSGGECCRPMLPSGSAANDRGTG